MGGLKCTNHSRSSYIIYWRRAISRTHRRKMTSKSSRQVTTSLDKKYALLFAPDEPQQLFLDIEAIQLCNDHISYQNSADNFIYCGIKNKMEQRSKWQDGNYNRLLPPLFVLHKLRLLLTIKITHKGSMKEYMNIIYSQLGIVGLGLNHILTICPFFNLLAHILSH